MLLRCASIETVYLDRIRALRGVSLEISPGEIVAVLGPNGAGKSTLLKSIVGLIDGQPEKGDIQLDSISIARRRPEAIAKLGIGYVPEDRGIFRELTVAENLELGLWGRRGQAARADLSRIESLFPILRERARQQADTLSGGEQQMLAIGRALLRRPRLLLLDEPSLGLAPQVCRLLFDALAQVARDGCAILLVEQNARLALRIAHRAAILESGRVVLQGSAAELAEHPDVRQSYLGIAGDLTRDESSNSFRLYRSRKRW